MNAILAHVQKATQGVERTDIDPPLRVDSESCQFFADRLAESLSSIAGSVVSQWQPSDENATRIRNAFLRVLSRCRYNSEQPISEAFKAAYEQSKQFREDPACEIALLDSLDGESQEAVERFRAEYKDDVLLRFGVKSRAERAKTARRDEALAYLDSLVADVGGSIVHWKGGISLRTYLRMLVIDRRHSHGSSVPSYEDCERFAELALATVDREGEIYNDSNVPITAMIPESSAVGRQASVVATSIEVHQKLLERAAPESNAYWYEANKNALTTDCVLVDAVVAGAKSATEMLHQRFGEQIERGVARIVRRQFRGQPQLEVDELVNFVFEKLLTPDRDTKLPKLDKFRGEGFLAVWLTEFVRNTCIKEFERLRKEKFAERKVLEEKLNLDSSNVVDVHFQDTEVETESATQVALYRDFFNSLAAQDRLLLKCLFVDRLSFAEIGRRFGRNRAQPKRWLSELLGQIREAFSIELDTDAMLAVLREFFAQEQQSQLPETRQ